MNSFYISLTVAFLAWVGLVTFLFRNASHTAWLAIIHSTFCQKVIVFRLVFIVPIAAVWIVGVVVAVKVHVVAVVLAAEETQSSGSTTRVVFYLRIAT